MPAPFGPFKVQAGRGIIDAAGNLVLTVHARRRHDGAERYEGSCPDAIDPVAADEFTAHVATVLNGPLRDQFGRTTAEAIQFAIDQIVAVGSGGWEDDDVHHSEAIGALEAALKVMG